MQSMYKLFPKSLVVIIENNLSGLFSLGQKGGLRRLQMNQTHATYTWGNLLTFKKSPHFLIGLAVGPNIQ